MCKFAVIDEKQNKRRNLGRLRFIREALCDMKMHDFKRWRVNSNYTTKSVALKQKLSNSAWTFKNEMHLYIINENSCLCKHS